MAAATTPRPFEAIAARRTAASVEKQFLTAGKSRTPKASATPILGNSGNSVSPSQAQPQSLQEIRKARFALHDHAQWVLRQDAEANGVIWRALEKCHTARHDAEVEIRAKDGSGEDGKPVAAFGKGPHRCKSPWGCPVCAPAISFRRATEINTAINCHGRAGGKLLFLTLTASHSLQTEGREFVALFQQAKEKLVRTKVWRRFCRFLLRPEGGHPGMIDAWDYTWGAAAGHHFHKHIICFIRADVRLTEAGVQALERALAEAWQRMLQGLGLNCTVERGLDLRAGTAAWGTLGGYTAKLAGLAAEIAGIAGGTKKGRKGRWTAWQLLRDSMDGREDLRPVWLSYIEATRGRQWLRWSMGLKRHFGITDVADEDTDVEAETEDALLAVLTSAAFQRVRRARKRAAVLKAAEDGGQTAVDHLLVGLPTHLPGSWTPRRREVHRLLSEESQRKLEAYIELERAGGFLTPELPPTRPTPPKPVPEINPGPHQLKLL